jgi:hypothetical protein
MIIVHTPVIWMGLGTDYPPSFYQKKTEKLAIICRKASPDPAITIEALRI